MSLDNIIDPYLQDKPTKQDLLFSLQYELDMLKNPSNTWYEELNNNTRLKLVRELKSYIHKLKGDVSQ